MKFYSMRSRRISKGLRIWSKLSRECQMTVSFITTNNNIRLILTDQNITSHSILSERKICWSGLTLWTREGQKWKSLTSFCQHSTLKKTDRRPAGPKGHKTTSESVEKSRNSFTTQEEDLSWTLSREPSTSSKEKTTSVQETFPGLLEEIDCHFYSF